MTARTPECLKARNMALHVLVAQKLRNEPARFQTVRENLLRWNAQRGWRSTPWLHEWLAAAELGIEAILAIALDPSDHGDQLRSSSPFSGVLDEAERLSFLKAWSQCDER